MPYKLSDLQQNNNFVTAKVKTVTTEPAVEQPIKKPKKTATKPVVKPKETDIVATALDILKVLMIVLVGIAAIALVGKGVWFLFSL